MSSYYYKTTAPAVLAAVREWDAKLAEFHAQRLKLGWVFGAVASPMYSGSERYVGGVKLGAGCELDVHWRRPDEYGYRALRNTAKPKRGATKEARATYKVEHDRLSALWKEHCPKRISKDDAWKEMGLDWGSIWLGGGVFFEYGGIVYLNFGFQLKPDGDQVEGSVEIVSSEYESALGQVVAQRKAA